MSNAADAINGRRVTKAQNPPARSENVFDTRSKILFSFCRKNESRVFNHDDSEARQWTCVHLAALPAADWQREFRILADQREISENPRLPVNRGFFVETERPDGLGTQRKQNMNTTQRKVPARFAPETRFDVRPAPPAPFRALQESELERLKDRLLREQLARTTDPGLNPPLRRAANEAAALAWTTNVPLLVFPTLFEEKVRRALFQVARQEWILERSRTLLAA